MMLEKTSDKLNKEQKSEDHVITYAPPSATDIAKIEGDSFEPASFVSHRASKKQVCTCVCVRVSCDHVHFVYVSLCVSHTGSQYQSGRS